MGNQGTRSELDFYLCQLAGAVVSALPDALGDALTPAVASEMARDNNRGWLRKQLLFTFGTTTAREAAATMQKGHIFPCPAVAEDGSPLRSGTQYAEMLKRHMEDVPFTPRTIQHNRRSHILVGIPGHPIEVLLKWKPGLCSNPELLKDISTPGESILPTWLLVPCEIPGMFRDKTYSQQREKAKEVGYRSLTLRETMWVLAILRSSCNHFLTTSLAGDWIRTPTVAKDGKKRICVGQNQRGNPWLTLCTSADESSGASTFLTTYQPDLT